MVDTNDWAKLLPEKLQNFSDILQQCKAIDPERTALAISKIEAIFAEILEIQEQLSQDHRDMGQNSDTPT